MGLGVVCYRLHGFFSGNVTGGIYGFSKIIVPLSSLL